MKQSKINQHGGWGWKRVGMKEDEGDSPVESQGLECSILPD